MWLIATAGVIACWTIVVGVEVTNVLLFGLDSKAGDEMSEENGIYWLLTLPFRSWILTTSTYYWTLLLIHSTSVLQQVKLISRSCAESPVNVKAIQDALKRVRETTELFEMLSFLFVFWMFCGLASLPALVEKMCYSEGLAVGYLLVCVYLPPMLIMVEVERLDQRVRETMNKKPDSMVEKEQLQGSGAGSAGLLPPHLELQLRDLKEEGRTGRPLFTLDTRCLAYYLVSLLCFGLLLIGSLRNSPSHHLGILRSEIDTDTDFP